MNGIEAIDDKVKLDLLIQWLSSYLNQQDIVDVLDEHIKELEQEEKKVDDFDDSKGSDEDLEMSSGGPDIDLNFNGGFDDFGSDEDFEEEPLEEPELASEVDLSNIEGEDLL